MATWKYRVYLETSYLRNYHISIFPLTPILTPAMEHDADIFFPGSVALPCSDIQGEWNHAYLHFYSSTANFANSCVNFRMLKICMQWKQMYKKSKLLCDIF